ncbi:MAG: hypothetical protein K9G67_12840 [Bacteroidales bacterium]|nr:hypothetical protein [Bacteroidales bacterium]MCF8344086.1 hypothetical protein [Bacteroidales bacterium]MCF8350595.1 hypothetical protein [Bacteroidales bacterium]MCF8377237.1 hypothetical protein [Bacteroidales bacterium]MCF8401983.1 hypothetical protein [Bacteroidales bacterium]
MKKNKSLLLFLLLLSVVLTCCKKDDTEDDLPDDNINEYSPNGNDLVNNQLVLGTSNMATSFWDVIPLSNGDFFYMGIFESFYSVGRITAEGNMVWEQVTSFRPATIMELNENLLVAGDKSGGSGASYEIVFLSLYDADEGQLLSSLIWEDIAKADVFGMDNEFLYGYESNNAGIVPLMLGYEYSKGELYKTGKFLFEDRPDQFFVEAMGDYVLGGVSNKYFSDFNSEKVIVYKLNNNKEIEWSVEFQATHPELAINGSAIWLEGDKVFVAGDVEVIEEDDPLDEAYWKDAWLACLSTSGDVLFERTYNLSIYTDYLADLCSDGTHLYACGRQSQHYKPPSYTMFGYGLIAKIDPSSGELSEYKTIGERTYGSGFNSIDYQNGSFKCAGFTKFRTYNPGSGNNFEGWFVDVAHF